MGRLVESGFHFIGTRRISLARYREVCGERDGERGVF